MVTKTEFIILDLLVSGEKYGLQMVKESGGKLKRGGIYVLLQRLEEKKLVTSRLMNDDPKNPRKRRIYSLTGMGARAHSAFQQHFDNLEGLSPA